MVVGAKGQKELGAAAARLLLLWSVCVCVCVCVRVASCCVRAFAVQLVGLVR